MVGMLVPLKGGIGDIVHPPIGKDYKWYISGIFPANWKIICHRSHLLGEPKTNIDYTFPYTACLMTGSLFHGL